MKLHTLSIVFILAAIPEVTFAASRNDLLRRQAISFERAAKINDDSTGLFRRQEQKYKPEMDKTEYDEMTRDYKVGGWCRDYDHGQGSDAVAGWEMCVDYCKKENPNAEQVNGVTPNPNCGMAFVPSDQVEAYEREIRSYVDHQGYKWRALPCDCDMADVAKIVTTFADIILPALGQGLCTLMDELYEGTMKALDIGLTVVDIASTFIPGPGTLVKVGSKALQIGVKAAKTLDKAASAGDKAQSALEFANWFGGGCGEEAHKPSMQDIQDKFFPALLAVPDDLAAPCVKGKCRDSDNDGNPDFPDGTPEHLPNPPDKQKNDQQTNKPSAPSSHSPESTTRPAATSSRKSITSSPATSSTPTVTLTSSASANHTARFTSNIKAQHTPTSSWNPTLSSLPTVSTSSIKVASSATTNATMAATVTSDAAEPTGTDEPENDDPAVPEIPVVDLFPVSTTSEVVSEATETAIAEPNVDEYVHEDPEEDRIHDSMSDTSDHERIAIVTSTHLGNTSVSTALITSGTNAFSSPTAGSSWKNTVWTGTDSDTGTTYITRIASNTGMPKATLGGISTLRTVTKRMSTTETTLVSITTVPVWQTQRW